MEIELLQLQCEKNVLNKIEGEDYIRYLLFENGSILPNSDISTPIIRIQHTEFPLCNYCRINELRRFYFIENITALSNGVYELRLRVDVLQSFKNDIMTTTAYISRNEFEYNRKLVDNEILAQNEKAVEEKIIETSLFIPSDSKYDSSVYYYVMNAMVN